MISLFFSKAGIVLRNKELDIAVGFDLFEFYKMWF